jgi:hypothetical protein
VPLAKEASKKVTVLQRKERSGQGGDKDGTEKDSLSLPASADACQKDGCRRRRRRTRSKIRSAGCERLSTLRGH